MIELGLPRPAVELIPHRPPMILIGELVAFTDDAAAVRGEIAEDNPFVDSEGAMHPAACIEILAQAAAAHEGYRRARDGDRASGGYLVGIRDFTIECGLRVGDPIEIRARRGLKFDSLQLVEGSVAVSGRRVASGQLKLYLDASAESPMRTGTETSPAGLPLPWQGAMVPVPSHWVRDVDRGSSRVTYALDGTVPAFHGHFPGDPLLPAVVSIVLATEARRMLDGRGTPLRRVRTAKFSRPIRPGATITVDVEIGGERPGTTWAAAVSVAGEPAASMTFDQN